MAISSALRYASVTLVKARLNSRTPLSDQQIENIIEQCEQYIDTLLKITSSTFTFDANKHQIIRDAVVNRAALLVAAAMPLSLQSLEEASTVIDVLSDALNGDLKLLSDNPYSDFIKGI